MFDRDLIIIDTETTGMSAFHDRVISHFSEDTTLTKYLNLIKELHPIYNARLLEKKEFIVLSKSMNKDD